MEYIHLYTISVEPLVEIYNKIVPLLGQAQTEFIFGKLALSVVFLLSIFRCSKLFRNASCNLVFVRLYCLSHFVFSPRLNNTAGRQKNTMYLFIFVERVKVGREATSTIP